MRSIYERSAVEGLQIRNTFTPATHAVHTETRATDGGAEGSAKQSISGRAIVYDDTVRIGDWFWERILPGAAEDDIAAGGVLSRYNHARLLGRQDNGTLILTDSEAGLDYRVIPNPGTGIGRDALAYAERGDLGGSSFVFRDVVVEREEKWKEGLPRYSVKKLRLFELGPVDTPAYPSTGKPEARTAFGEMLRRAVELREGSAGYEHLAREVWAAKARLALLGAKHEVQHGENMRGDRRGSPLDQRVAR